MRIVSWGIQNPIAISLISFIVLAFGLTSALTMERTIFPKTRPTMVTVSVDMDGGATSDQVDRSVIQLIYPHLLGIDGIAEIVSVAQSNRGQLQITVNEGADADEVKKLIDDRLSDVSNLPNNARRPVAAVFNPKLTALYLAVVGNRFSDTDLAAEAETVMNELRESWGVQNVRLLVPRSYEISIQCPTPRLASRGLTIHAIADQIRSQTVDAFAGEVRGKDGTILIKGGAVKQTVTQLRRLPIRLQTGESVLLEDVVGRENFSIGLTEDKVLMEVSGRRAVVINVEQGEGDDLISTSDTVRAFAEQRVTRPGMSLVVLNDRALFTRDSFEMIGGDAAQGLLLLFICLSVFVNWKVGLWATNGVFFALTGTFIVLNCLGQTLNMMILLGFGVSAGLIVDDAIVMGEEFDRHCRSGMSSKEAALATVSKIAIPVTVMVFASVCAFSPLLMISGSWGDRLRPLPIALISALVLSLLEAIFILPVHYAHHSDPESRLMRWLQFVFMPLIKIADIVHPRLIRGLELYGQKIVHPLLTAMLRHRYAVLLLLASAVVLQYQLVAHRYVKVELEPALDSENLDIRMEMEAGTPHDATVRNTHSLIDSLKKTSEAFVRELKCPHLVKEHLVVVGRHGSHTASIMVQLIRSHDGRTITGQQFLDRWRSMTPPLPGVTALKFALKDGTRSKPIDLELTGKEYASLAQAAGELVQTLKTMPQVVEVETSNKPGPQMVKVTQKAHLPPGAIAEAQMVGIVAAQFYGTTVDEYYDQNNEVKITLRGAAQERDSLYHLQTLRLPNGQTLGQLADFDYFRGPVEIRRRNGVQTIHVTADVNFATGATSTGLRDRVADEMIPSLRQKFPDVRCAFKGDVQRSVTSMKQSFLVSLVVVYMLLATYFRSYVEPLVLIVAVVISVLGAVLGHWFMGRPLSLMSIFGIIGLIGIVVNNAIFLVDAIKELVREGHSIKEALPMGSISRLTPICLTSVIEISSAVPMFFETSVNAQWMIPILISFVFGMLFSTLVILFAVPVGYAVILDVMSLGNRLMYGKSPTPEELILNE